uniref:COesterase domain-containing protein n=1 Tax=Syphacia muris TaxID=451379 RepID=A0A0N5AE11_9BILA
MIFTYLLAWLFFACGLVGLKMSFLLRDPESVKSSAQLRRISPAPIWISDTQLLETPRFPVGFVPVLPNYPPPPYDRVCNEMYPQQCFQTVNNRLV